MNQSHLPTLLCQSGNAYWFDQEQVGRQILLPETPNGSDQLSPERSHCLPAGLVFSHPAFQAAKTANG